MGLPSEMRDLWRSRSSRSLVIASPAEDQKALRAKDCIQEGLREGVKGASIACVVTSVPMFVAVRVFPQAKASLNLTGRLLITCGVSVAAFYLYCDQAILACARRNAKYDKTS